MQPGDRVRVIDNPSRVGVLTSDAPIGEGRRRRLIVSFSDGVEPVLAASLEKVEAETTDPYLLMKSGRYGGASHLRGAITYYRLSGRLANLIYSLNTTNTKFLPYQFKPVLQFLDSPSRGIVIADEVGLGKTIEAGLIWTELRARHDARKLLVVCPAMLREKWCDELYNRFGVKAEMVDAGELRHRLERARDNPTEEMALVVSMQGTRPPKGWNSTKEPSNSATAKLARFLESEAEDVPLLDLVVIDEAHYLRNKETQTHKFAALLRPVTDGLVMLTATPIQMRSTDLFNLLHLLDEDAFPLEWTYDQSVQANAPIVALRDQLQRGTVTQDEFRVALEKSVSLRWFDGSEQIRYLLQNLPSQEQLTTTRGRAEYADLLDRVNPRAKVVTRTLKRDVSELRVQREPVTLRVQMSDAERAFYENVTDAVREYCERNDASEGFLLTIPQRQMSSSMAAACQGWTMKLKGESADDPQEMVSELLGESPIVAEQLANLAQVKVPTRSSSGELLRELVAIARQTGDYRTLAANDSKFSQLLKGLKAYWRDNPSKKVVLFAFYRNTLHYLARRFAEVGVTSAVLHGGMDKQEILKNFEKPEGPSILLSSEVAAEGIDLQFSSLLVNYDLPWNPAKIEQRIGRIDRIGQEASKILIWNLVYADTLDERVHERLLSRLNIFKTALGSMEEILGEEVRRLTSDLLSHKLTPEGELRRIEQTAVAIENLRITQLELDERATQLLGHGDFIQNKAKAAFDLGRYIRGDDLYHYVKDYLETEFPGTRLLVSDEAVRKGRLELSIDGRVAFNLFLTESRLVGRTSILSNHPYVLWFDNQAGNSPRGVEKITQDHPLTRFVSERQNVSKKGPLYFPTSAVELPVSKVPGFLPGLYVYAIMRWTFSGPRDVERLVYEGRNLDTGAALDEEQLEFLVNTAALYGTDWHAAAKNVVDHDKAASLQDDCRASIEENFIGSKALQLRENRDRIRAMIGSLDQDLLRRRGAIEQRIAKYEVSENHRQKRVAAMELGKLKKLVQKYEEKKHALGLKESIDPRQRDVSSGVIKVV
jgi:superfamily II DNA or RNA helicase